MPRSASFKRLRSENSNIDNSAPASKVCIIRLVPAKSNDVEKHDQTQSNRASSSETSDVTRSFLSSSTSLLSHNVTKELLISNKSSKTGQTSAFPTTLSNNVQSNQDLHVDDESALEMYLPPDLLPSTSQFDDGYVEFVSDDDDDDDSPSTLRVDERISESILDSSHKSDPISYGGDYMDFLKPKKPRGWNANRHKLKFQQKWLIEFPFIEYDAKNNVMYCKACRKYVNDWRKTSPFVAGNSNFRVSMLKYHERSSMHIECQELADTVASESSDGSDKDLYKEQLSHVFKSVYFVFKNKMPYTHYPQLCESQKREGTDFSVYTSHLKVVPLVGKFICMAFEKELTQRISCVTEFSLVIDASFRRNIESHDLVYLKYLDGLEIRTVFLGVIDSSAKLHDSMYKILCDLFKKYSVNRWTSKIVYIMTDKSDSHMWLEGLIDIIRRTSPHTYFASVTYLPHKVNYCASVVQNHKITSTFDALLWSIYCCYERVDKAKKNLTHMSKVLDDIIECYGNLPKNSYTTMYYEALNAVEKDYAGLVSLLETEQKLINCEVKIRKAGAKILSVITRSSFLYKLALFIDIFYCVKEFADKLSSEDILPFDVDMLLDEVCAGVETAANGDAQTALNMLEELSENSCSFRDVEITEYNSVEHVLPEVKKFSADVILYLKSLVNDDTLIENCIIFNTSMWPEDDDELSRYGNIEFIKFFKKFSAEEEKEDLDLVLTEWNIFKSKVLSMFPYEVRQNPKSVVLKMMLEHQGEFPYVIPVLRKILLLNFESSEIKRGYHEMCLNKSYTRSMLSLQSLQTSMMVSMYGPPQSDFDFSLALDLFLNSRNRKFRKKIIDNKLLLF